MMFFLTKILEIISGILGERIITYICSLLGKDWLKWNIRMFFFFCAKHFIPAILISCITFFLWGQWRVYVIDAVLRNFYKFDNISYMHQVLIVQHFFFFLITLFFLASADLVYAREKRKQITESYAMLVSGQRMRDAVSDLSEKVYVSDCVLGSMIEHIPGSVILIDRLFNIVLCNSGYREFCRKNFIPVNIGKPVFYIFDFKQNFPFQEYVLNTFMNGTEATDVPIRFETERKTFDFSADFFPVKNGEVLMCMVIVKRKKVESPGL